MTQLERHQDSKWPTSCLAPHNGPDARTNVMSVQQEEKNSLKQNLKLEVWRRNRINNDTETLLDTRVPSVSFGSRHKQFLLLTSVSGPVAKNLTFTLGLLSRPRLKSIKFVNVDLNPKYFLWINKLY